MTKNNNLFLICNLISWQVHFLILRDANFLILSPAFYMNGWWATTATTSIFIMAAVTDWLDGYIARKVSNFCVLKKSTFFRCKFMLVDV